jgi:hypothetical protein
MSASGMLNGWPMSLIIVRINSGVWFIGCDA